MGMGPSLYRHAPSEEVAAPWVSLLSHGPGGQALFVHSSNGFGRTVDHLPARHAGECQVPVSPRHIH